MGETRKSSLFKLIARESAGVPTAFSDNTDYFENEENTEIGIVLAKEKDDLLVKYAMHNVSSQLFVSKYQLYLPKKEELKELIEKQLQV